MSVSDVLFPLQYRRKVLAFVCMNPDEWIHLRELARQTGASPGTLKKEVDALTAVGLLQTRRVGNQTQFRVNSDHPVFPELSALVRKTMGLVDVLRMALAALHDQVKVAFVFGSMASASEHAYSDVDVMLIGSLSFAQAVQALHPVQAQLGREINPKVMTLEEWSAKKSSGSAFVLDVLAKPKLFVRGSEDEL